MFIKIVILVTIALQIVATWVSLSLLKRTKYNLSWILISLGFLFLLFRRLIEALPFYIDFEPREYRLLFIWFGIATSFLFAAGLILVRKIFDYMEEKEKGKRAEEEKYLSIILKAEENERKRLANELHDGIGPLLSTIKMSASALKTTDKKLENNEIIKNIEKATSESIRAVKDMSNNLSPHVIENFGLSRALKNFIEKINEAGLIKFDYTISLYNENLSKDIEITLYRVICELINNTLKHSGAKNIILNIVSTKTYITVDYKDDGVGFEVDNLFKPKIKGLGFYNIYSRINSLKGEINTYAAPKDGTEIKIKIPLENENK